jgi:hypothetical protein
MKEYDVVSTRGTSRNIEIEVPSCKKCPFFRPTEYSGIFCAYLPTITDRKEGMEPLIDEATAGPPPDWCGLKRASVTISIDPLHESRCPEGGDHEPVEKLSATICKKCNVVLDNHPPPKIPMGR